MNERKWTPGPWRSGNGYNSIVSDHPTGEDNVDSDDNFSAYGGYLIAESVFSAENMGIIKAAPDLYEALEPLEEEAEFLSKGGEGDDYMLPVTLSVKQYRAIVAAMAKARGEA